VLSGPLNQAAGPSESPTTCVFLANRLVTQNDEVRSPVSLRPAGPGRWTGTLWLATPFEAGQYDARLYGWDGDKRQPLQGTDGRPAILQIQVDQR